MDKRKKHTLVEMAHYALHAKDLTTKFWAKVVYYSDYLLNLVLTRVVSYMTPVKKCCGNKPSVGHLKTFRCIAWEHIFDAFKKNYDAKSHACIIIGHSEESKAYRLFDPIK